MTLVIAGYSDSDKVPQFVGETKFGAGPVLAGSFTKTLLLVGLKKTGGSAVLDEEVVDVTSEDVSIAKFGRGSELHLGCRAALRMRTGGYALKAVAVTPAGGAASATATITVSGTSSSAGTLKIYIGGQLCDVNIPSGTAQNDIADLISSRAAQLPDLPVLSITDSTNVVTITAAVGVRGNQIAVALDTSEGPGTTTFTLASTGTSVTSTFKYLGGGTGVETLTAVLATLFGDRYHYVVPAQNDATSLGLWETQTDSKAGPLEGRMEHVVAAVNGTVSAAITLAQTNINNQRFQVLELENGETTPFEVAAAMAAERVVTESSQPNSGYDRLILKGVRAQRVKGDWATRTEQQAMLDAGVTPLKSLPSGEVEVVRAVTTRSLDGSTPDYRTLDTAEAVVPDAVRDHLRLFWTTVHLPANPYVKPDPVAGEADPPAGVTTPKRWNDDVKGQLRDLQDRLWLTQVELNAPQSEWNSAGRRIMQAVPVVPLPLQHSIGVSVRQMNPT